MGAANVRSAVAAGNAAAADRHQFLQRLRHADAHNLWRLSSVKHREPKEHQRVRPNAVLFAEGPTL